MDLKELKLKEPQKNEGKYLRKPEWLKVSIGGNSLTYGNTRNIIQGHCLHTICASGKCPNQGECWSRGTASFMIGGDICTRCCRFCNTKSGKPLPLDPMEPLNIAKSIVAMNLKHAVITSVDRDDLPDGGSQHWKETLLAIHKLAPSVTCEVLIPDFKGNTVAIDNILDAGANIVSHNMETVRRLTPTVRSVATYQGSLNVLSYIASKGITTKTGIMLGLGETTSEVLELFDDVLQTGASIITIGQYLQPTRKHIPVQEYITPKQFDEYKAIALEKGFKYVESGPLVRSSYHAEEHLEGVHQISSPRNKSCCNTKVPLTLNKLGK